MRQFVSIRSVDSTGATHSLILYLFKPTSGRLNFFNAPLHTTSQSEREKESERIDKREGRRGCQKWKGRRRDREWSRKKRRDVNDRGREKQEGGEKMGGLWAREACFQCWLTRQKGERQGVHTHILSLSHTYAFSFFLSLSNKNTHTYWATYCQSCHRIRNRRLKRTGSELT